MTNDTLELKPEQQAIIKQAEDFSSQLAAVKINNQQQYTTAGEYLKSVKSVYKQVEDLRKSITSPMDLAKARVMDFFRKPLDALTNAEAAIKRCMLTYQQEQEKIRQEQERKLAAEAEKKRQEALAKAEAARAEGKEAKAEKYEEKAAQVVAPVLASNVEKVAGITTKKAWKFEITDENLIPRQYLTPDLVKIGKQVRAVGDTVLISGIIIYADDIISAGR